MYQLNAEMVRALVSNLTYRRALDIYTKKEIKLIRLSQDHIDAQVFDDHWYHISVIYNSEETTYECSCQDVMPCPHVTAAMLQSIRFQKENNPDLPNEQNEEIKKRNSEIIPSWKSFFLSAEITNRIFRVDEYQQKWLPFFLIKIEKQKISILPKLVYVKKDGTMGRWQYYKNESFNYNNLVRIPAVEQVLKYLKDLAPLKDKYYQLPLPEIPGFVFDALLKVPIYYDKVNFINSAIENASHMDSIIKFKLERKGKKAIFSAHLLHNDLLLPLNNSYTIISESPLYLYKDLKLFRISNVEVAGVLQPFLTKEKNTFVFNNEDLAQFWQEYFPGFPYKEDIIVDEALQGETRKEITDKHIYLTEDNQNLYLNPLVSGSLSEPIYSK